MAGVHSSQSRNLKVLFIGCIKLLPTQQVLSFLPGWAVLRTWARLFPPQTQLCMENDTQRVTTQREEPGGLFGFLPSARGALAGPGSPRGSMEARGRGVGSPSPMPRLPAPVSSGTGHQLSSGGPEGPTGGPRPGLTAWGSRPGSSQAGPGRSARGLCWGRWRQT